MDVCSGMSTTGLLVCSFGFISAVLGLDAFWVRGAEEHGDLLRKQTQLNGFIAFGACAAMLWLVLWIGPCSHDGF